jgi:NAD-dependent dihydropyrimidine dehydrogenase PreA subunit
VSHRSDGVLRSEQLGGVVPSRERLARGPVIIIECVESIPCNPCVDACPKGVITIDGDMNGTPVCDFETCDGCGVCVSACPGLAIFVLDVSLEGDDATVSIPYEYRPLPEIGDEVVTLSREGEEIGTGTVGRVLNSKALDRTPIVTLRVPKADAMSVRHFRARP